MLSDYQQVKTALSIPVDDLTQDAKIQQIVQAADQVVKSFCHRTFEFTSYIKEFPFKGNAPDLPLLQRPILAVLATGTLTQGSTTISGISCSAPYSTAQIQSGMPVAVTGAATATMRPAIPPFTTISNLSPSTSPTQVTMSQAATASGTCPLVFGLDVYIDFGGNYGFGLNAYLNGPSNSSRLFVGLDYAPLVDQPDGSSKSGLLTLLGQSGFGGGLWALAPLGWGFGNIGGYGPYGGPLTQALPPMWPTYPGCICVTYSAGEATWVGATAPNGLLPSTTTIPADLTMAVTGLACWMFANVDAGLIQTTSESFQGYSRALVDAGRNALEKSDGLGSIRDILSRYVEVAI